MRAATVSFFLFLFSVTAEAQKDWNVYFTLAPTVTFGTSFSDGTREFRSPSNKTGVNTIYPLYSVLDGRPNHELTNAQNLFRKFSWGVLAEKSINERNSLNIGFEVGARGYKVISASSISSLISFRNLAVPIYFSRYRWLGNFWTLKGNYGGFLNYSYSIPKDNRVVKIERGQDFYPLVGGGVEMAYLGKEGKLSFELAYYHGWRNVIDHIYVGVDNGSGERITTNASTLRLTMKYNFKRLKGMGRKKRNSEPVSVVDNETDGFNARSLKDAKSVTISSDSFEICFRDDQTVDDDSIVVMWNGYQVSNAIGLTKQMECIKLKMLSGKNMLVVHALNEGRISPNTYEIIITEGEEEHHVRMKSDLKNSAVLEVIRKP